MYIGPGSFADSEQDGGAKGEPHSPRAEAAEAEGRTAVKPVLSSRSRLEPSFKEWSRNRLLPKKVNTKKSFFAKLENSRLPNISQVLGIV